MLANLNEKKYIILEKDTVLKIEDITLVLLNPSYTEQLAKLAMDKRIWEYAAELLYKPEEFKDKWLDKAFTQMEQMKRICFIIFCEEQITGTSSYYDIDMQNKTLNIGYTWLHPDFWKTRINATSKLILIDYAFNSLKFNRVGFSVDTINQRSYKALKKLGIRQEGTLRNHLILSNGRIRHSAVFSVIYEEWQEVKEIIMKNIEL